MTMLTAAVAGIAGGMLVAPAVNVLDLAVGRFALRPMLRRRLARSARGSIVLTFDDGPSDSFDTRLLELLRSRDAKATFYLLELRAQGRSERIEALRRDGHEVGTHSFGHLDAYRVGSRVARQDFRDGLALCEAEQRPVRRFRPPFGRVSLSTYRSVLGAGIAFDLWTLDSGDTFVRLPNVAEIVRAAESSGGCVVLMHSHDRRRTRPNDEEYTLAVTDALIDLGRRRGWPLRRMCDLGE